MDLHPFKDIFMPDRVSVILTVSLGKNRIYSMLSFITISLSCLYKKKVFRSTNENQTSICITTFSVNGSFHTISSDPWIIEPILIVISLLLFAAKFFAVGLNLSKMSELDMSSRL
jgi:hypothetical protein